MNKIYKMIEEYVPIKNILKEKENGDFLILANKHSDIYYLNNIAKEIYLLIDNKINISGIYGKIKSEYDVNEDELQEDIIDFIRDLQWKNLIRLKEVIK